MHRQFGETYAESWARDFVIAELGHRTVVQALAEGESVKASAMTSTPKLRS